MNWNRLIAAGVVVAIALAVVIGSVIAADRANDAASPEQPEFQLPPGWTMEDMQACIEAGTPGEMHERLANDVGTWRGKTTMWMAPGAEPIESESTATVTSLMDGRYTTLEWEGEMPGMGPFRGFGIYGYDNVTQQFVSTWIDNHSTGIMTGVGELSPDGKTIAWECTHNCPLTKKPTIMRQVETITGPGAKTMEMYGTDPKSGKEFKMMTIEMTKT